MRLQNFRILRLAKGFQRPLKPGLHPCSVDNIPNRYEIGAQVAFHNVVIPHTKDLIFVMYVDSLLSSLEILL